MMGDYINVRFQRGALRNYLYGYCLLSTLIFILIIFDVITYKDSNNIHKEFSDKDYTDIIQDVEFAITESNFRIVNRINIGEAIQERKENIFPRNEVILFCNLTIAEEMLKLEPDFINFCPYKITIAERSENSNLNESTVQIWPCHYDEVKSYILSILLGVNMILRMLISPTRLRGTDLRNCPKVPIPI